MEYIAKDDPIRDEISNVFSLPDDELDKKIAGERQGDEQSLAFKSLNTYEGRYYKGLYPTQKGWDAGRKHNAYFEHGPLAWAFGSMTAREYLDMLNSPRVKELNRNYNLLHVADKDYVFKNCKFSDMSISISGYGSLSRYLDKKHEDFYMNRSWSPLIISSTFKKYGHVAASVFSDPSTLDKIDIEEAKRLRNSPEWPTHIYYTPISNFDVLGWPITKMLDRMANNEYRESKTFVTLFICTPEQSKQARVEYFKKNPRYRQEVIDLREKLGLEPEAI